MFDGVCALCNGAVSFLHKRLKNKNYEFIPSESDKGIKILEEYSIQQISQDSMVVIIKNQTFIKSDAVLKIVKDMKAHWKIFLIFKIVPKPIRDFIYTWISRNRHKLIRK